MSTLEGLAHSMTQSVDQWNQVSLMNVHIPQYDGSQDIHQFINEYETITSLLEENQKIKLLVKAFSAGNYGHWYKRVLEPAMKTINVKWSDIKKLITERFSSGHEIDRHLRRLETMKYDPSGDMKLIDFVESFIYCFDKVHGLSGKEETCCRALKIKLPDDVSRQLSLFAEYRNARTTKDLLDAVKNYELNITVQPTTNKLEHREMVSIMKSMFDNYHKEFVAAIQPKLMKLNINDSKSKSRHHSREHCRCVSSSDEDAHNRKSRDSSKNRSEHSRANSETSREASPHANRYDKHRYNKRYHSHDNTGDEKNNHRQSSSRHHSKHDNNDGSDKTHQLIGNESKSNVEFNLELENSPKYKAYIEKKGKPPAPCIFCKALHWFQDCPWNLNE